MTTDVRLEVSGWVETARKNGRWQRVKDTRVVNQVAIKQVAQYGKIIMELWVGKMLKKCV